MNEDTRSFANALRAALREDPDVILVGEMRIWRPIQSAAVASTPKPWRALPHGQPRAHMPLILVGEMRDLETFGHLVFGTLHTSSAAQTVDRMVDVFPPEQQTQIRVQLSGSLVAVFSQICRVSSVG